MVETCPHCNTILTAGLIPLEYLRKGYYGEWDGKTPRYYKRTISVEVRGVYDGGLFYQCPDCGGRWHRWPEGHELRRKAEEYVNAASVPQDSEDAAHS